MSSAPSGRALPLLYFLLLSAVVGSLALVGFLVDRLPLLPASVSRAYQRALLASISGLSRPIDGWAEATLDAPVGEPTVESPP